jgi:protein disulfide-isomerase A1
LQFPTLKFFPSAGGAPVEYNGGRETADIVKWVKGKSGPATTTVASAADLEKLADRELLALGFFAAGSEADKAFNAAALAADDATFAVVTDAAVRASFGVSGDAVVLVQRFAGAAEKRVPFEGAVTDSKALTAFVVANSLPLVIAFTQESAPKIFRGPVKTHFLLFVDSAADASPEVKAAFATTAEAFKGRALFVTVAPTEDRIVSYFGVTKEQMPTAVLVSMPEGEPMKKYSFDGKVLDVKSLTGFADSFFAGTLKPFLKSEEVPAGPDNGVTVVVGKNFKEVALDASKDVLLEFYAPWCGHCKQVRCAAAARPGVGVARRGAART